MTNKSTFEEGKYAYFVTLFSDTEEYHAEILFCQDHWEVMQQSMMRIER